MKIDELDTPALIVDLDILEGNIRRMADLAREAGVKLRPHTKTHKNPAVAHMQLKYGANGITCAKLGEAEVMAQAGIDDILVAYPIWGRSKIDRLIGLHKRISIHVSLDSLEVARALSEAFAPLNRRLGVLVEVEIGLGRLGVPPGKPLIDFVRSLMKLPGLEYRGLLAHAGHVHRVEKLDEVAQVGKQEGEVMVAAARELERAGFITREISVGATPTVPYSAKVPGVTEIRPGTYVYGDVNCMDIGAATVDQCALRVISTVIGTPTPDRVIIDAGSKSLSADATRNGGFGVIYAHPEVRVHKLYEEHGVIHIDRSRYPYKVGDRMEVIPNHACMCVNQWDQVVAVRSGYVEAVWPILGRGKLT